jgi:hypothetical protein
MKVLELLQRLKEISPQDWDKEIRVQAYRDTWEITDTYLKDYNETQPIYVIVVDTEK